MGRKKRTLEEETKRALISKANITSMADVQELFKETIAEFMENGLESELEEKLGYSKYDYHQKAESGSDNNRNGHSKKMLKTSMGSVEIDVPRDRNGEFEPQKIRLDYQYRQ